jgi:hypothetical protein
MIREIMMKIIIADAFTGIEGHSTGNGLETDEIDLPKDISSIAVGKDRFDLVAKLQPEGGWKEISSPRKRTLKFPSFADRDGFHPAVILAEDGRIFATGRITEENVGVNEFIKESAGMFETRDRFDIFYNDIFAVYKEDDHRTDYDESALLSKTPRHFSSRVDLDYVHEIRPLHRCLIEGGELCFDSLFIPPAKRISLRPYNCSKAYDLELIACIDRPRQARAEAVYVPDGVMVPTTLIHLNGQVYSSDRKQTDKLMSMLLKMSYENEFWSMSLHSYFKIKSECDTE